MVTLNAIVPTHTQVCKMVMRISPMGLDIKEIRQMSDLSLLSELPRELKQVTGTTPKYRAIYAKVLDGDIPAEKENGRWHYRHEDVPAIAKALGLAAA